MQNRLCHSSSHIRLGIAPGVPSRQLSNLLALQREEEPETTIALSESTGDALMLGLRESRYDVGLALADAMDASLHSEPLWREEMAIAMPSRYPLMRHARLTLDDVRRYPIFRWQAEPCPLLNRRMAVDEAAQPFNAEYVFSFGMLAAWVAAGYGIGITAQSRITRARVWDICMRPLVSDSDEPFDVVTHVLHRHEESSAAHASFIRRARQIARAEHARFPIHSYAAAKPP